MIKYLSVILLIISFLVNTGYTLNKSSAYYKAYQKGNVFLKNKKYNKAIIEYEKAIKEKTDFNQPYLNLGIIYDQYLKQYGIALIYYIKYLENGGKKVDKVKGWIKNISNLKHLTSDKEFITLKKGIKYHNEGVKLAKKQKLKSAVKKFKKSLEIIPYYVKAHYAIGLAYFKTKEYGKAYKHFMRVLKYDPESISFIESYYYLGVLHDDVLLKDYENALSFYNYYQDHKGEKNVDKFKNPIEKVNGLISKSIISFQKNKRDEAIKILKKAEKIKPLDIRIYNNLGVMYIHLKKYNKAEDILKKSLKIRRDAGDTYYNLACLYSIKGNTDKSLKYFKKGLLYFTKKIIMKSQTDQDLKNLSKTKEYKKIIKKQLD